MVLERNDKLVQALRSRIKGKVLSPIDPDFEAAVRVWNGAVTSRPSAIVRCETTEDVRQAVRIASEQNFPVSVLGGGHDWAGRSICDEGVTIDLRSMRGVSCDLTNRTVTVEGGATTGDVLGALPDDFVTVTGTVKAVGTVGLTLGGGYGPLNGRFGLALDNLIRAEVVLADGSVRTASDSEDAELLYALRGGGGNFGVVTSCTLQIHQVPQVLSGLILFPLSHAVDTLGRYQKLLDRAPDELGLLAGFLAGPDGVPMFFIAPLWSGDAMEGDLLFEEMTSLPGAITVHKSWSPYAASLGIFDAHVVNGRHHFIETRTLGRLDDLSIKVLVEGARRMTTPFSGIVIHDFHGAATRVKADATAFPLRKEHLMLELVSAWDADSEEAAIGHREWAKSISRDLAGHSLPGGYVNILGSDERERARLFYGETSARLQLTKQRLDPGNLFRSAAGAIY